MSAQRLPLKGSPTRLKVVIICEDLESGKHAKELHDQLCVALGSNIAFVPEVWTFRALQNPQLQEFAAREISEADMILFSTRGDADLPRWLKSWLETRLSPAARPKALVALFDPAKSPPQI